MATGVTGSLYQPLSRGSFELNEMLCYFPFGVESTWRVTYFITKNVTDTSEETAYYCRVRGK